MNRKALVIELAPVAPDCFSDRLSWVEFLVAAEDARSTGDRGPLDFRRSPPTFNLQFDYCKECPAKHAWSMQAQGRCNPHHLRDLAEKEKAGA